MRPECLGGLDRNPGSATYLICFRFPNLLAVVFAKIPHAKVGANGVRDDEVSINVLTRKSPSDTDSRE